jgi:hypothetical protein
MALPFQHEDGTVKCSSSFKIKKKRSSGVTPGMLPSPENRDKRERGVKENVKRKGGSMFVKSFKVVDAAESKRSSDHQALVTWDMLVLDFRCDYIDT